MFSTHPWTRLTTLASTSCACSVLMFLESCSPEVREIWVSGIETSLVGIVSALTGLLTTGVSALFTGSTQGDGSPATVEAILELARQVLC